MKTKEEYIRFWIEQAKDDWNAAEVLLQSHNFIQSLFFAHLVIEKLCKSLWIKYNSESVPPRTHNLIYLLSFTPLKLTEEQNDFLLKLNRFQMEGRYPDYFSNMYDICNESFTKEILTSTDQFRIWLIENLE
ncbi:MAG: HEPN domain-containing protein [Bacteroidia bacterium]|nr:HEPN domain-containing protein [Bacteroidia bacterium]